MLPDAYRAIKLLDFNIGAAAAVALLNPLGAQIDALIALGLGPFGLGLSAQFNAALAAQASLSLSLSIGDISLLASLKASIAALASLQAALAGALALGLPPIQLSLGAELTATVALAASLSVQLGSIQLLIKAALAIKIPAIKAAAGFAAALNAGPIFCIAFSGTTVRNVSTFLDGEVANGQLEAVADSATLGVDTAGVFGVLLFGAAPSAKVGFDAIIAVPP
jgi:hypothetical protein